MLTAETPTMGIQTTSTPCDTQKTQISHTTSLSRTFNIMSTSTPNTNTNKGATALARDFCEEHGILNYYSGPAPNNGTGDVERNVAGEDFIFSISWLAQCVELQVQNGLQPTVFSKEISCESLMTQNLMECGDKTSNGGYVDVGCLRFSSRAKGWALDGK
ncbi:hypothetical protein LY76DRAFT_88286 [Colletotrichum caudatum]|nr:hypothetical protein LY76DRAFT_88286 [Colletotrichum caudatum]